MEAPLYRWIIRPIFSLFPPETIHHLVFGLLGIPGISRILGWVYRFEHPSLERRLFGLTFRNPVGLAAGFDKDARRFQELGDLGFGFVEVGTVTPLPQPGNPKPRLFRLSPDQALINRMGFNNEGLSAMVARLRAVKPEVIIGGNIGKNKVTPNESAVSDYETCFLALFDWVDYFVVNVSSPNTPNLRALQEKEPLTALLTHLQTLNNRQQARKPILLKIAPDLGDEQLDDIITIVQETGIDGVIATNTTISREGLAINPQTVSKIGNGGLSGKPLTQRSTEVIRYLHQRSGGAFPIIGVGGIHSPQDALDKLQAGASLVQLYSGFIYEGPALIRRIKRHINKIQ